MNIDRCPYILDMRKLKSTTRATRGSIYLIFSMFSSRGYLGIVEVHYTSTTIIRTGYSSNTVIHAGYSWILLHASNLSPQSNQLVPTSIIQPSSYTPLFPGYLWAENVELIIFRNTPVTLILYLSKRSMNIQNIGYREMGHHVLCNMGYFVCQQNLWSGIQQLEYPTATLSHSATIRSSQLLWQMGTLSKWRWTTVKWKLWECQPTLLGDLEITTQKPWLNVGALNL